jgi:hypothetical protein
MANRACSAVSLIPLEIWWMILDEVIDCPRYFATIYDGDDWANDSRAYTYRWDDEDYKESRVQIQTLSSVCRIWRQFTVQRRGRSLILDDNKIGDPYRARVKKARRVNITHTLDSSTLSLIGETVNWEIIRIRQTHANQLDTLSFPYLRRLILASRDPIPFHKNLYLNCLGSLVNLTWLQYSARFSSLRFSLSNDTILLPNLRVLVYRMYRAFYSPSMVLRLPSLQHLSVRSNKSITILSNMAELLHPYAQTLKSIAISLNCNRRRKFQFLQWNELPNLQELILDGQIPLDFHPLPHDHPLSKFYVRHSDVKEISSWMDSDNLRLIRLLDARWDHGALKSSRGLWSISKSDMDQLLEKAETRGIQLEASLSSTKLLSICELESQES